MNNITLDYNKKGVCIMTYIVDGKEYNEEGFKKLKESLEKNKNKLILLENGQYKIVQHLLG